VQVPGAQVPEISARAYPESIYSPVYPTSIMEECLHQLIFRIIDNEIGTRNGGRTIIGAKKASLSWKWFSFMQGTWIGMKSGIVLKTIAFPFLSVVGDR
jgi:hypothetical protein